MDTNSQPAISRGATAVMYLMSGGIDVRSTVSASTLNLNGTGTANIGTLNVSTTSTLTGLLAATAGISATANVTATTFTSTAIATDGTGNFACYNTTTKAITMSTIACVGASDPNLKTDIAMLDGVKALQDLLSLDTFTFRYKDSAHLNPGRFYGVNALQIRKAFPELSVLNPDGVTYSVDYPKLIVPVIASVKEQQKELYDFTHMGFVGRMRWLFTGQ